MKINYDMTWDQILAAAQSNKIRSAQQFRAAALTAARMEQRENRFIYAQQKDQDRLRALLED